MKLLLNFHVNSNSRVRINVFLCLLHYIFEEKYNPKLKEKKKNLLFKNSLIATLLIFLIKATFSRFRGLGSLKDSHMGCQVKLDYY